MYLSLANKEDLDEPVAGREAVQQPLLVVGGRLVVRSGRAVLGQRLDALLGVLQLQQPHVHRLDVQQDLLELAHVLGRHLVGAFDAEKVEVD